MIVETIRKVVAGGSLTRAEAMDAAAELMEGQATPAQIGALLVALRMKGETPEEAAGFALAMRERMARVTPKRLPTLDTCGTGGSAFRVFNVSTAAAFVAAAAGVVVAKHGNRAMSGVCGSADVLEALGVRVTLSPEECAACIEEVGISFLFAQRHHPSMKHVAPSRREIGVRTLFNLVGPLTNPAGAKRQVMGVYAPELGSLAIAALKELGSERALVVHGEIGLDEISTIGQTQCYELRDGRISDYALTPQDFGLTEPARAEALAPAETPEANAALVREVLRGKPESADAQARADLVAVNGAAGLRISGLAEDWTQALTLARETLDSGQALEVLERLIEYTQRQAQP